MQELDVWIVLDESGDYAVGTSREQAQELYDNDIGAEGVALRFIHLPVRANLPQTVEMPAATVPDDD